MKDLPIQQCIHFLAHHPQEFDPEHWNDFSSEQWCTLLLKSNLKFCPYATFQDVLSDPEIMNLLVIGLAETYKGKSIGRNDLEYSLRLSDKDLFIKFRDNKITYDQLRARGAALQKFATYMVLDDFKHKLNPKIMDNLE